MKTDTGRSFRSTAATAAALLAMALGGCDRKPSDPPRPAAHAASPAAGLGVAVAAPASDGGRRL